MCFVPALTSIVENPNENLYMYHQIVEFWFEETGPEQWWMKDGDFDAPLVELFGRNGIQNNLDFELKHKEIIDRFGRYPHRNAILGRQSTAEEIEFLKRPGSGF